MPETAPTYREVVRHDVPTYICLICSSMEQEHSATNFDYFTLHMQQRHNGVMVKEGAEGVEQPAPEPEDG